MIHGDDAGGQGCQSCVMGATLALPAAPAFELMLIFTCTQACRAPAKKRNDCVLMAARIANVEPKLPFCSIGAIFQTASAMSGSLELTDPFTLICLYAALPPKYDCVQHAVHYRP